MENCTVSESTTLPGRININQRRAKILMGIPGITEEIVTEIISRRSEETTDTTQNRAARNMAAFGEHRHARRNAGFDPIY